MCFGDIYAAEKMLFLDIVINIFFIGARGCNHVGNALNVELKEHTRGGFWSYVELRRGAVQRWCTV